MFAPAIPRNIAIIGSMAFALCAVEALAWWWTHPAPAGLGDPVLTYRPDTASHRGTETAASRSRPDAHQTDNHDPTSPAAPLPESTTTPLPEIVAKSLPSLRCSDGIAARIDRADGVTIHLAFFEWNMLDSSSTMEAFKHLPEECLGSIGMKLVEHRPARLHQIDGESIPFEHTVFRDRTGTVVHAFKGTWVSGARTLAGDGIRGGREQWRKLRWKAAAQRFRPAHARVTQGAVRGIPNPESAWRTFQETVLQNLTFDAMQTAGR
jgi:hypothetical protein